MKHFVFIKVSSHEMFEKNCKDVETPINSNIYLMTGDYESEIELWDVYNPSPTLDRKFILSGVWSQSLGLIMKTKQNLELRGDLTGVHFSVAIIDSPPYTKVINTGQQVDELTLKRLLFIKPLFYLLIFNKTAIQI